jgi:mannose-6-phosphate isomerase-like protein (cupin superfamily)
MKHQVVHLPEGIGLGLALNDDAFWRRRDRDELAAGRVLTVFSYDSTWDYQERHPDGDELAFVLDGACDVLVDVGSGERPVQLSAGQACVIPSGAWHRAAIHQPATLLFITPVPTRTQHRQLNG